MPSTTSQQLSTQEINEKPSLISQDVDNDLSQSQLKQQNSTEVE